MHWTLQALQAELFLEVYHLYPREYNLSQLQKVSVSEQGNVQLAGYAKIPQRLRKTS